MQACCIPDDKCEHLKHEAGLSDNVGWYIVIFPYFPKLTITTYSQSSIMEFMETVAKAPEWTKDQLEEQIIHFVIETDQVCIRFNLDTCHLISLYALSIIDHDAFYDLLKFNGHGKTKDSDIPHHTKVTESVLACDYEIEADLAQELKVN